MNRVLFIVAFAHLSSGAVFGQKESSQLVNQSSSSHDNVNSARLQDLLSMVASIGGGGDNDGQSRESHSMRMDYDNSLVRRKLKFDWDINLDKFGEYKLNWRVNYASNHATFGLELANDDNDSSLNSTKEDSFQFRSGRDIFALGFSDYGQLKSSDFCIIWFDLSHQIHLQDAMTNKNNQLELIDSRDSVCKLIRFNENKLKQQQETKNMPEETNEVDYEGGEQISIKNEKQAKDKSTTNKVEIIFSRPLEVCEPKRSRKYYPIDNGTTHLVWFALKGPVLSIDGLNLSQLMMTNNSKGEFDFGLTRVQLITKAKNHHQQQHQEESTKMTDWVKQKTNSLQREKFHEIKMDRYQIPARETTYWCKLFKLPAKFESRKYHITSYEAVIGQGNEHVVHHMELFNCANLSPHQRADLDDLYHTHGAWQGECSSSTRPKATEPCRRVILAWAMGARPLVYPEQVGQPIGGHGYSPYVVLEVHYNNIDSRANLVDSSGLGFHYTPKVRPFEAGVLEVGLEYTDKNSIPPGMLAPLAGYCVSECTRAAMTGGGGGGGGGSGYSKLQDVSVSSRHKTLLTNKQEGEWEKKDEQEQEHEQEEKQKQGNNNHQEDGIYIFAAQMHTHLAGVASWTEHVREGRLLGELQRDNHYSAHFQEIRLLPEPVHVRPGDALIHYCLYDTRKRANITLGGYATTDEMCVSYLHYYPKIDLEVCKSSVETRALERYFAYLAREESQRTSLGLLIEGDEHHVGYNYNNQHDRSKTIPTSKSVSENYKSIDWSAKRSRQLLEFYASAPLAVQCNRSNGQRWPGAWNGVVPTRLWDDDDEDDDQDHCGGHLMNHVGRDNRSRIDEQLAGGWRREEAEEEDEEDDQLEGRSRRMELPYERRPFCGHKLAKYRGRGHGRRHAQCQRKSPDPWGRADHSAGCCC